MKQIFRKSLLDKLSSPEQLDKMIVITPPSFWIALSGAAVIIVAAVIWGFFGELPENVSATGIYVNEDGTKKVYSETTGVVSEILVSNGDAVSKGDVIATLNTDDIEENIKDYETRIAAVENITMDSTDDVVNSDSQNLVDVKNQMITVKQTLNSDQKLLELRMAELADAQAEAAESEAKYLEAEAAYFSSLYIDDSTSEQVAYSETQSAYSTAISYYESANSSLSSAEVNYQQAKNSYNAYKNQLNEANAIINKLEEAATLLDSALKDALGDNYSNDIFQNLTTDKTTVDDLNINDNEKKVRLMMH